MPRDATKRINIGDIAKAAGVSMTTVSRVMNKVPTVSEENRRRVGEAIRKYNYRPNPIAQKLAAGHSNTVALIIPRYEGIFHSYFAMQVLRGVGMAAERTRFDLLLHITDGSSAPSPGAVDGVIFIDIYGCEELLDAAIDEGQRVVVLNHFLEDLPINCVAIDNKTAAEHAVDYLVKLGHREIGTITGDLKTQAGLDRLDGFIQGMKARQLPVREELIKHGDFGLPSARQAMQELLKVKQAPTALFVASDDMALEAIRAAQAAGVRIPEELSIVGFDDSPVAAQATIPLTTIHQPLDEMGRLAMDILVQQIRGKKRSPTKLYLPTKLIERQTCRQTWLER
jgi:DNA-binding LacI/PurR family transcriptional regulator